MFSKTVDNYKENPEYDFIDLYTENIIQDNKKMLDDMFKCDGVMKEILDLYNKYKGINDD